MPSLLICLLWYCYEVNRPLFISITTVETIVVAVGVVVIAMEQICLKILWPKNNHFSLLAFYGLEIWNWQLDSSVLGYFLQLQLVCWPELKLSEGQTDMEIKMVQSQGSADAQGSVDADCPEGALVVDQSACIWIPIKAISSWTLMVADLTM